MNNNFANWSNWSNLGNWGKMASGPWPEMQAINAELCEGIMRRSVEASSEAVSKFIQLTQSMSSSSRKPDRVIRSQINFITDSIEDAFDYTSDCFDIVKNYYGKCQSIWEKQAEQVYSQACPPQKAGRKDRQQEQTIN